MRGRRLNVYIEIQWWLRNVMRRKSSDIQLLTGILALASACLILMVVAGGAAQMYRTFVPWVSGSNIETVYWRSVSFGIKVAVTFMLFCASWIAYIIIKVSKNK